MSGVTGLSSTTTPNVTCSPCRRRQAAASPTTAVSVPDPLPGQIVVDGTLGGGGHTRLLAERVGPNGYVLALDRDPVSLARAEEQLRGQAVKLSQANFRELPAVLDEVGVAAVDGVLLDLGLSSDQLADGQRGFSFAAAGELDMRFNPDEGEPAWRLCERLPADELADLIYEYGEERFSRRIAAAIVEQRRTAPIRTAEDLASLIRRVVPRSRDTHLDPATRTFQALRIAVNDELGALRSALETFPKRVKIGGKLAVISFHSLEDRLVKEAFRADPRWESTTKKPITAADDELHANPRSRSAKLRIARRVLKGTLRKLISGGQTGVDRAGLDAARGLGLPHGGWCPRGRLAADGSIPPIYAVQELESPQDHVRTEKNVCDSDGTLILARGALTGGTELTRKFTQQHNKPLLIIDLIRPPPLGRAVEWARDLRLGTINVAGPRESNAPGVQTQAQAWITRWLMELI
jgi:16S rRNA (cytosine1402-N4)-methyltransferase